LLPHIALVAQRTKEEAISLLLQSAEKGATQLTLMPETYLSHNALKEYLTLLQEKGLLEYLDSKMKFRTTVKQLALIIENWKW
jgi:predicted transcriptional regulator